ncbi:hypothetical protein C0J52_04436 [Blattella germanica]|nr:hypothetical protein C0J52_04436 [Blattella germanica]
MDITAIQEFYRGTNILITGGTGFMGKVLIEKLLRSCHHLNRIYMLVRSKKGKNVDVRVHELFEDPLYDRLRNEHPNFREKIRIVSGDCGEPGLGLSARDRAGIMEHVHIVFHVAATVRFDENIQTAINTNIRGTRDLMILCRNCRNIKFIANKECKEKEPLAGWIDNLYGPTGTVVGVGMGIIRTMQINGNAKADLVPCDMVVSALIASAWDVYERKRSKQTIGFMGNGGDDDDGDGDGDGDGDDDDDAAANSCKISCSNVYVGFCFN